MAIVTGQDIPPSLATRLKATLGLRKDPNGPGLIASQNNPSYTDSTPLQRRALSLFATSTATWFRTNWNGHYADGAGAQFFAARKADLLASRFPPAYWTTATQSEDLTEYATPDEVYVDSVQPGPPYADPLHRNTVCKVKTISDTYATPTGNGTPQQPAPGWAATTIDTAVRDLHIAQRRLLFTLPLSYSETDPRPVAVHLTGTITATATTRGNVLWFLPTVAGQFWASTQGAIAPLPKIMNFWVQSQRQPYSIPSENPYGWAHTRDVDTIQDGTAWAVWRAPSGINRLWLRVGTPPTRGRYHARNDAIQVYHSLKAIVYLGKGPHD